MAPVYWHILEGWLAISVPCSLWFCWMVRDPVLERRELLELMEGDDPC